MLLARLFENRCFDFAVGRSTIIPSWSSTLAGFAVAAVVVVEQAGHRAGLLPVPVVAAHHRSLHRQSARLVVAFVANLTVSPGAPSTYSNQRTCHALPERSLIRKQQMPRRFGTLLVLCRGGCLNGGSTIRENEKNGFVRTYVTNYDIMVHFLFRKM